MPRVRDVLIVPTDPDPAFAELPDWETNPPAGWEGNAVDVGDGITVVSLDDAEAGAVMDAAEPAGENYEATRQWGQLVAFVREIGADEYERDGDNYDAGGELNETIALSRLVRDNAFCSEYAARIIERDGRPRQIAPILSLERRLAYRIQTGRPWLSEAEVAELSTLREAYRAVELPEKVTRALWRTERSVHSPYLSESVTNSVTGLEALLKTERHQATNQFTTRVPALADELGHARDDVDWAAVYAARSDASHGARIALFSPPSWSAAGAPHPEAIVLVAAAQTVLRAAVRKAIEDPDFRTKFTDDDSVRAAWPL